MMQHAAKYPNAEIGITGLLAVAMKAMAVVKAVRAATRPGREGSL